MNKIENNHIRSIAKHVNILNSEVGLLQNDVRWIKKLMWYLTGALTIGAGKVIIYG